MNVFLSIGPERSKNKIDDSIRGEAVEIALSRGMLSVLIETENNEEGLARTLASLVGAAVEGVVREVIICDGGSGDGTAKVADDSGCKFLAGADLLSGIRQARGEWLLMLEPGARLVEGWTESVVDHLHGSTSPARFQRRAGGGRSFLRRLLRGRGLSSGLLISKRQALLLAAPGQRGDALAANMRRRKLAAEIVTAS